jgi:signal transduction histidine kinase
MPYLLGLAIVEHGLARHERQLRVESTVGEGSAFARDFPARRVACSRPALETTGT